MIGALKPFDEKEHDTWDKKGKDALLQKLRKKIPEYDHIENDNKYGIDVLSISKKTGKVVMAWEVEVRYENWKGDIDFPFDKINCIERKDHLWKRSQKMRNDILPYEIADDALVVYVQMNNLCNRAVLIDGDIILKYKQIPWANRKANNEYVRQVDIFRTKQINL